MLNEMFVRAYALMLSLRRDEEGASAVEYGLILGLIAVVIIIALGVIGTQLESTYCSVATKLGGTC